MAVAVKILQVLIKTSVSGQAKAVDVAAGAGDMGGQVVIRAQGDAKYQLKDLSQQGLGPQTIKAKRLGQNLLINFEEGIEPDLVIEDYYSQTVDATDGLIGQVSDGGMQHYLVENQQAFVNLAQLADGGNLVKAVLANSQNLAAIMPTALGSSVVNSGVVSTLAAAPLGAVGALGVATVNQLQSSPEATPIVTDSGYGFLVLAALAAEQELSLAQADFDAAEQALAAALAALGATATPAQLAAVEVAQAALTAAAAALATAVTNAQTAVDAANAAAAAAKETAPDFASLNAAIGAATTDVQGASATTAASEAATDGQVAALVQAAAAAGQALGVSQTNFDQAEQALAAAVAALSATATPAQLAAVEVAQAALTAAAAALATAVTNAQTAVDAANAAAAAANETAPDLANLNAAIGAASSDVQGAPATTAASEAATDGKVAALVQAAAAAGQALGVSQTDFDQAEQALAAAVAALAATATPAQLAAVEVAQAALTAAAAALATAVTNAQAAVDAANAAAAAANETAPDLASLNAAIGAATTDVQGAPATTAASEAATDGKVAALVQTAAAAGQALGVAQTDFDQAEQALAAAVAALAATATPAQLAAVEAAQAALTAAAAALATAVTNAQAAVDAANAAAAAANETAPDLASLNAAIGAATTDVQGAPATTAASEAATDGQVAARLKAAMDAAISLGDAQAVCDAAEVTLANALTQLSEPATAEQLAAVEAAQNARTAAAAALDAAANNAQQAADAALATAAAANEAAPSLASVSAAIATAQADVLATPATTAASEAITDAHVKTWADNAQSAATAATQAAAAANEAAADLAQAVAALGEPATAEQMAAVESLQTALAAAAAVAATKAAEAAALAQGASAAATATAETVPASVAAATSAAALAHTAATQNVAPTLLDVTQPEALAELQDASAQKMGVISGTLSVTDLDLNSADGISQLSAATSAATLTWSAGATLPAGVNVAALVASGALSFTGTPASDGKTSSITWTYDPAAVNLDWMHKADTLTIEYPITVSDGTQTSNAGSLVITINGSWDTATLSGDFEKAINEDVVTAVGGQLSVADLDAGHTTFRTPAAAALNGTYGNFTFDAVTGEWAYTLDNSRPEVQALVKDQTVTDTLMVGSFDGSDWQDLVVTITGKNDTAAITGTATGVATEDSATAASGTLTVTDVDTGEALFQTPASLTGTYGTFTFDETTGDWGYALDSTKASVQALPAGTQVTDTLTVVSKDGTASQNIVVTITGTNDTAAITGTATGVATEDSATAAGGTLTVSDVDTGEAVFQAPASLAGTYGTFTFNETTGVWGYALDSTKASVQALPAGTQVTDTLTVLSKDGTDTQAIVVTITGTNDTAAITGTATGVATEDSATAAGGTLTVTDVDTGEAVFQVPASLTGTYGIFTFDETTGDWGYALDSTKASVQALPAGTQVTDTLTVLSKDGTDTQDIVVTITGTNDAPSLSTTSAAKFTSGDAPKAINGVVTLADVDSATLASATVSITAGFVSGEDVLSLNNVGNADIGNIVASYVAGTGLLNMTSAGGTATQAQWQAALRAVAYSNALVIPTVGERTISYAINDGLDTSAPLTSTINVKAGPDQTVSFTSMTKDSGVAGSNVDWLTNDDSAGRLVSGTLSAPLEANQTLKVYADGVEIVNAVVSGTNWQVTDTAGYSADWTYTAYVADANGRTGPEASRVVTNDVTAEAAPVITAVTDSATAAIANSGTTTNALSSVSGTGVTGNTIYLYDNTVTNLVGTATVVNGAWTVSVAGLSNVAGGSNAFAAVQMDPAGNTSVMSNVWTVKAGANLVPNGDFDNYSGFTSGLPQQTTIDWFNSGFQISGPSSSTQDRNPQPLTRTGGALVSTAGGSSINWAVDSYQYIVPNSTIYWDTMAVLLGKDSRMYATAHSNSGLVTVYQSGTFQVEAGKTYQFGLNYGTNDWATQGLIVIVDGVSMALTTPIGLGETNGITGALTATYTAAQTKSISIQITGNNTGNGGIGGDIYLDDISFKLATTPADGSLVAGEHMGGTPAVDNLSYGGGFVNALAGDDVITVTGTDLQSRLLAGGVIQGGEGYDTLVLAAGTSLDMNALRAAQTVESLQQIEAITLQGNSNLTLNANDVLSLGGEVVGGKVRLVINKTTTDQVTLDNLDMNPGHEGTWVSSGSAKIGADSYEVLNHSTTQAQVLMRVPDPVFGSSSATAAVAENTPAGTVVHDATADADVGMTYSLVAGADAALFSIDEETGEVRFKASPDFETPQDAGANNVYNFTVRAANNAGGTADQAVAITVTDGVDIGQATVNLGVGFGTLSAPKDIDGRTYYYWDSASGNGGWDRGYNNFVEGIFNQDVNGNVKPAGIDGPTDIYRYATINGVRLALPTAGIQTDENGYVQGVVNGIMRNAGTAVNSGATYNSKYSDMLAVWDAYNGTETDIVNAATAHPSTANNVRYYWTATPVSVTGTPNGQHVMVDFLSGDAVGRADNLEYNVMVQVLSPQAGLAMPVITLASGQGKLINPVEVEGKWYYSWDRNGNGVLTGYNYDPDYFYGNELNTLFNKDIFGNTNTVGADMNEVFRYTTLKDANGADVWMAVPTYGGMVNASGYADIVDWQNTQMNFGANTSVNAYGTINTVYDDFAAIADAGGVPPLGWLNTYYKTSSVYMVNGAVRTDQHLSYLNGDFYTLTDSGSQYGAFALEMVKPNLAPVLADTALSFGTASASSLPVGAVGVLVSDLMGGVTDGDAGAPKGVAIIDIQYGGTLWYSTNGGTNWLMSKDLTAQKALLLGADADNRIFFQPGKNMTGTVNDAITFRAWDRSRGEEGQFLGNNTTVNGGASPFSAATETLSVNVGTTPVVLDLNRDGSLSYSHVAMDVNGNGRLDHTAWAGAQDGVLVWDKNGDGLVRDASQYAFTQYGGKTDLQGLAAGFDSNADGVFDASDAKFAEFAVWQDANQNGVSDVGEVRSLADVGVASIDLSSDGVQRSPADGVSEAGRTTATTTDGTSMLVADAAFEFSALSYRVSAEGDLSLLGEQMSLDLSSLVSVHGALHSVDLSGTGANSLKISLSDLLSLGEQQPLRVLGDADDSVVVDAAQWTASGSAQAEGHSYAVYAASNGQQLWLDQQIHMA